MDKIKNFEIQGSNKEVKNHIQDLCEQIVRTVHPQKIILFGSYAYGQPHEDSDIDLLVVMPFEGSPKRQAFKILMQIQPLIPLDLLARTPEFIEERVSLGDCFMQEIVEQGKVLYEADYVKMDRKSGRRLEQRAA